MSWIKKQPSRGQALFMAVIALLLLASTVFAVAVEGRRATVFFWVAVVMDLALLGLSIWLYRRAARATDAQ
jgi:hypothetical protein